MAKIDTRAPQSHLTQWAAQFAVASELCKLRYQVSFTSGNTTPVADIVAISQSGQPALIDVKGLYKKNSWIIQRKPRRPNLFYVLVFVPHDRANEFFILSQQIANKLINGELERLGRPKDYPITGIRWEQAARYKDNWRSLPS